MNVNIAHLAEFHLDGHPDDPGRLRLDELQTLFRLCARHSDDRLLLVPAEEGVKYLGNASPGEDPGHWMYFFPRPTYFAWVRDPSQPRVEDVASYGRVHRVASKDEMAALLATESGVAWTSHPRIKASYATPDALRDEPYLGDGRWLGATWKAMPADLSHDRLGARSLDVLDDMNLWGKGRKLVFGEVDVFEVDPSHELWGHANVNYVRLPAVPGFGDFSAIVDVLRRGDLFVTTGEIVLRDVRARRAGVSADVAWTFPLAFAEVVWGDGAGVRRARAVELPHGEHGRARIDVPADLSRAQWARLEVWDVARDGAFTQPLDVAR
jgi:hypothetical protein